MFWWINNYPRLCEEIMMCESKSSKWNTNTKKHFPLNVKSRITLTYWMKRVTNKTNKLHYTILSVSSGKQICKSKNNNFGYFRSKPKLNYIEENKQIWKNFNRNRCTILLIHISCLTFIYIIHEYRITKQLYNTVN